LRKTRNAHSGLRGTPPQDPEQHLREVQFQCNVLNYRPTPYPGPVVLLRTGSLRRRSSHDRTAGWGKLASHVEVYELPGDHAMLKTEHVEILAEHIDRCLRTYHMEAQRDLAPSTHR
jgi:thioesterase domain-containing protein